MGLARLQRVPDELHEPFGLLGGQHVVQPLAHQHRGAGHQGRVVGGQHLDIPALGIQHQQHIRNGLGDGVQARGRARQRPLGGHALLHVVQQQAQHHGGRGEGQQIRQGQRLVDALHGLGGQQLEQRDHRRVQQQPEQCQGDGLHTQPPPGAALAVHQPHGGAQPDHHQPHLGPRAPQPQAAGGRHQRRNARHQRAAKQAGHAQHHRACVKDHARHQHHRGEHAHHADAAEDQPRKDLAHPRVLAPDADVEPMQKAQRQQQRNAFDQLNEHGPPCFPREKPMMEETLRSVNV